MKKIALLFVCLSMMSSIFSQNDGKKVPSVQLTDLNGKPINTANLSEKGPIVISFWATWCAPCKRELNTIHEEYEEWQKETGITIVAVSIDDEKTKLRFRYTLTVKVGNMLFYLIQTGILNAQWVLEMSRTLF